MLAGNLEDGPMYKLITVRKMLGHFVSTLSYSVSDTLLNAQPTVSQLSSLVHW